MRITVLFRILLLTAASYGLAEVALLRAASPGGESPEASHALPRLVDLGATKCIPCRMMKPVLEKLAKDHAGRMEVVFIDVWENRGASERYGVRVIPTQIFYDATGTERARHEGFMSEKDILAKWKELGFPFDRPAAERKS